MAVAFKSATAADGTFSATGATAWDDGMTVVSGGAASAVLFLDSAGTAVSASSGFTWAAATGQGLVMAAGTATTDVAALSLTRTNNNAAVATGVKWTFTDTSSAAGFLPFQILGGSAGTTNLLSVSKTGINGTAVNGGIAFQVLVPTTNALGFGRNGSTGNLQFYGGGVTPADNNAQGALTTAAAWVAISTGAYTWSSTTSAGNPGIDTALSRGAAGQVDVGTAVGNASGTLNAAAYKVGGTTGADFGPGLPTSITVVKGIITAIS